MGRSVTAPVLAMVGGTFAYVPCVASAAFGHLDRVQIAPVPTVGSRCAASSAQRLPAVQQSPKNSTGRLSPLVLASPALVRRARRPDIRATRDRAGLATKTIPEPLGPHQ